MSICPEGLIAGLNNQQIEAVTINHDGAILVLAGAGCGKTTVLTRRIAWLAQNKISQERILALTFTRKAAQEMAERTAQIKGIDTAKPMPTITTFHAFALRILSDRPDGLSNFERLGYRACPRLIAEKDRFALIARSSSVSDRRQLEADVIRLDSLLACHGVHPQKLSRLSADQMGLLSRIQGRMLEHKQNAGLWDFSDLVQEVMRLFKNFPAILRYYETIFGALLVDEFQDTNPLQVAFLTQLRATKKSFFAVGDDDQAIYGFRGADIMPILTFKNQFPGALVLKLEINYRSTPAILKVANRVFRVKSASFQKRLVSGRYAERESTGHTWPLPKIRVFQNQVVGVDWIIHEISKITLSASVPMSEVVLLFRINQTLEWVRQHLSERYPAERLPLFMTIHGSKGLEFHTVFLCDLEEEVFPSYRRPRRIRLRGIRAWFVWFFSGYSPVPEECDLEEEKRLFYVGITRAKIRLYLISIREKKLFGRMRTFYPSRFLRILRPFF